MRFMVSVSHSIHNNDLKQLLALRKLKFNI